LLRSVEISIVIRMNVAVVIPSYKVKSKILSVLAGIGPEIQRIYVVDDKCPENSGNYVLEQCDDDRVAVLHHEVNLGVGGAMVTGYRRAIADGMDIVVKIDGDGQMNPLLIKKFIKPILNGQCDYTKGNRFYFLDDSKSMPFVRWIGNALLSFLNKFSTGYWNVFDPTNGFTAISVSCLKAINLDKLSQRYFFESDILFRLNIANASVMDIPMASVYADEVSNLKISKIIVPFMYGHLKNFTKRIFYKYFLRDFSLASLELCVGFVLLMFGIVFGAVEWITASQAGVAATSGTVMLAGMPVILGVQLLLSFFGYDIEMGTKHQAMFPLVNGME